MSEKSPVRAQCSHNEMNFNVGLQAAAFALAAASLPRKPVRLTILVAAYVLNLTVFRLNTCANCVYYGEVCHLGWGRLTARLFERADEPDLDAFRRRFALNLAFFLLLLIYPLHAMRKRPGLLALYATVLLATGVAMPFACGKCAMKEACPMGARIGEIAPGCSNGSASSVELD